MFENLPDRVSVYEVSPRDGLQNERATVPLEASCASSTRSSAAGLGRIEITSFVSPKWIPQLADADEVAQHAKAPAGVSFSALCPNARGLARARAAGMREIAVFVSASETHNRKNVNKTIAETIAAFEETIGPARAAGMRVRGYVSTVWGCPYEGEVDPERAVAIAKKLLDMGCYQVSLGDTIGVGTPRQTARILERVLGEMAPGARRDAHARHAGHRAGQRPRGSGDGHSRLRRERRRNGRLPVRARRRGQPRDRRSRSSCSTGWESRRASISSASSRRGRWPRASSGAHLPGKVHLAGVRSLKA